MAKEKPGALIYWDTFSSLVTLKPEKLKTMLQAIYNFSRYGEEPDFAGDEVLEFGWPGIRQKLIIDNESYETKRNQRKNAVNARWEKERKRKKEYERIQPNTDEYERIRNIPYTNTDTNTNTKTETNTDTEANTNIQPPSTGVDNGTKPTRHGEYNNVLLTNEELKKLQAEFPGDWQARIEELSEYIASSGKEYKNHLATLRRWAKDEKNKQNKGFTRASGDWCEGITPDDHANDIELPY